MKKHLIFHFFCLILPLFAMATKPFSFHLVSDPSHLNPAKLSTSQSNYFYSTIFEGLYSYDDKKGLIPKGAKKCTWITKTHLTCSLNQKKKWSDGSPILAKHYEQAFQYLIDPNQYARRVDLLFGIKNAKKIYQKKMSPKKLGVVAKSPFRIEFFFEKPDGDFLYKLSSPVLVPWKQIPTKNNWKTNLYNGPFVITEWNSQKVLMKPNPHYKNSELKPKLEIYFVEDDSTALQLFNSKKLELLRRMPATEIPFYKKTDEFLQLPVARFDYVGFNGDLVDFPNLRKALVHSVDYSEFKKLFHALGRAGCPSLPESYFTKTPCYNFDLKRAKEYLAKVPKEALEKRYPMYFSTMGGEDIRRAIEWFQHQWKKHLGLNIEAKPLEHKMYLAMLKKGIKGVYRKGIPLDRPSCLAAIENFRSDAPENFLKINSVKLDKSIDNLKNNSRISRNKKLCTAAVQNLLEEYRYIPLGRIHYSLLARKNFTGWKLNELNQLDLSDLRAVKK